MIINIPKYYSEYWQRIKGGEKEIDVITITLGEDPYRRARKLHCMLCGTPTDFQYVGNIINVSVGEVPTQIPTIVRCHKKDCRQSYLIEKILPRAVFI